MSSKLVRFAAVFAVAALGLAALAAGAKKPLPVTPKIDGRGLVELAGVTKPLGANWGPANLQIWGPGWQFWQQDWGGFKGDGDMAYKGHCGVGGASVDISEKISRLADGAFNYSWAFRATNGKLGLQRIRLFVPLTLKHFQGGQILVDGKSVGTLPAALGDEAINLPAGNSYEFRGANDCSFKVWNVKGNLLLRDSRKDKRDEYQLWVEAPGLPAAANATISFDALAIAPQDPPFVMEPGPDYAVLPFSSEVKPGTILDFSTQTSAGLYGRLVTDQNGHFVPASAPSRRVRLMGANLCYNANTFDGIESLGVTSSQMCDRVAATFRRMGYNAVRFHHLDVTLMNGQWNGFWNRKTFPGFDPAQLKRFDYMLYACKKQGLYVTLDLYAMGCIGAVPGVEGTVYGDIKGLVPICPAAYDVWFKEAMEFLNHVNPYTGLAWKDDPALYAICPLNEDSIASAWGAKASKPLYEKAFADWKAKHPELTAKYADKQLMARFLAEVKVASNRKIAADLAAHGVHALLAGSNWWDTQAQTFERDSLDVVDNHQYCDHPQGWPPPAHYNQGSSLTCANPTYMVPCMMTPTRVFGKPFSVTEWNYCQPNTARSESGPTMGAYAALQDWDVIYRFAWSHDAGRIVKPSPIEHFDIVSDPLNQYSERIAVLLFLRGDVAPARESYCYGVSMDEATRDGVGDMWAKGLFPHEFNALGLMHRIGSQVMEPGRPITGKYTAVVARSETAPDASLLNGNTYRSAKSLDPGFAQRREFVSDTKEISINNKTGVLRVMTPRTEAITAYPGNPAVTAGGLTVQPLDTFTTVSASAMDGKDLRTSRRILLFHLTNVVNSNEVFDGPGMHMIKKTGTLPYLVKTGTAKVALRSSVPGLTLYAIKSDGTRFAKIPATYANGAYTFDLVIAPADPAATMAYELANN